MNVSIAALARQILERRDGEMEVLAIHQFEGDVDAHDDALQRRLESDFTAQCDRAIAELTAEFGPPIETGADDDGDLPIGGVFRYATWELQQQVLFVAAAHEDRECPFLLMVGTSGPE